MTKEVDLAHAPPPAGAERPDQIPFEDFRVTAEDIVIDVGCGDGMVCVYAGHQGAEVIGIDVDAFLVNRLTEIMRQIPARSWRGIVSDCNPIPLPSAMATVIVATEVLEHVDDPVLFLAELARIGRPGARYVISVPDPASEELMRLVAPDWYWKKPFHQIVFQHEQLDQMVRTAGLEIERRQPAGFGWSMHWLFRMLDSPMPGVPLPDSPLIQHWEGVCHALKTHPRGTVLIEGLTRVLPKSQVMLARKPAGEGTSASSFGGPIWSKGRWTRRIKDGTLRVGGLDIHWKIRRRTAR